MAFLEIDIMTQPRLSLADFSDVVEGIYDCALNFENWQTVLPRIANLIVGVHDRVNFARQMYRSR